MKSILAFAIALFVCTGAFAQAVEENKVAQNRSNKKAGKDWSNKGTLAISLIQITESGYGTGFSYEHAVDEKGTVSFYLPAMVTFYKSKMAPYSPDGEKYYNMTAYIMPGIKWYPTGMGKVKYALGTSMVAGYGKTHAKSVAYSQNTGGVEIIYTSTVYGNFYRFVMGGIINNSLNFQVKEHIYVGMELGFGLTLYETFDNERTFAGEMLMQGAFKVGYTF